MNASHWRRWVVNPAVALLALLVVACGGPSTGDVEGQVLAMHDATRQPDLQAGVNVVVAGKNVERVTQTDADGKYAFKDLPSGDYGIAFSLPAKEGEPGLQPEERQFNVSPGKVETVSVVLLTEGIAKPEVPAELAHAAQSGQAVTPGSGLTNNPFFWYFVFNQPWLGGYTRPPVVIATGPQRTITVDAPQPAPPGRTYTNYGPSGAPGTKPAPQVVQSKGVTRPGQSAALPGAPAAPAAPGGNDASKGVTRPGQAPAGGSSGSSASGGSSAGSSGSGGAVSPPRVGAGSGSSAGRAPSSGGSRSVSPPRVRVGRR